MGYVLVSWQKYVPILRKSITKTPQKMDDHKIEEAKDEEEKASKDSFSARKALKAKKKEKARSELAFDKGNLLKGIDNKTVKKF